MTTSRRKFLKNTASVAATSAIVSQIPPYEKLMQLIMGGLIDKAHAGNSNLNNYLAFNMYGAAPRWTFDHFLKLKSTDSFVSNATIATALTTSGANYTDSSFSLIDHNGTLVPALWGSQVASAKGGNRPMRELLDSMMVMRGYGSGVDGHPANNIKHNRAMTSLGSVPGYMVAQSNSLLKSVEYPFNASLSSYMSPDGLGQTTVADGSGNPNQNMVQSIMLPFSGRQNLEGVQALRNRYSQSIRDVARELKSRTPSGIASQINLDYDSAMRTIQGGVEALEATWPALIAKYSDLISRTVRDRSVAGFSDRPIVFANDNGQADISFGVEHVDGRFIALPGADIRDWMNSFQATHLVQSFAMAEFLFFNKLTSAFSIVLPDFVFTNLIGQFIRNNDNQTIPDGSRQRTFTLRMDQHRMGSVTGTYLNSCFFRAVAACFLELKDVFQTVKVGNQNLWERMFIHNITDFGRSPRNSGGGSDHGFDAMISSIITGANKSGLQVAGNVFADATSFYGTNPGDYIGSWGLRAPTSVSGTLTSLAPVHICSTLAKLLNFNSNPWGNFAAPLFELKNGSVISNTEAKSV